MDNDRFTEEELKEHFEGREVMLELVKRFGIPMHLKDGATYLQNVTLELTPDNLPMLHCEYVIAKLEKEKDVIVELINTGSNLWEWESTDGLKWNVMLNDGDLPVEAPQVMADSKDKMKVLIKLKEAGFTAEEIIELGTVGLLYV